MSTNDLDLERIIGSTAAIHKCIALFDDNVSFAYPVSKTLVTCRYDDPHSQKRFYFHNSPIGIIEISSSFVASASVSPGFPRDPSAALIVSSIDGSNPTKLADIGRGISAMAFSPDEKFLCCCLFDGTVTVYDLSTFEVASSYRPKSDHPAAFVVWNTDFTSSSKYSLFCAFGQTLYSCNFVFDRAAFSFRFALSPVPLPSLRRDFSSACFSHNLLFLATTAGEVVLINPSSLSLLSVVPIGTIITSLIPSPFPSFQCLLITATGSILGIFPIAHSHHWEARVIPPSPSGSTPLPSAVVARTSFAFLRPVTADLINVMVVSADNSIYLAQISPQSATFGLIEQSHTSPITTVVVDPFESDIVIACDMSGRICRWSLSSYKIISSTNLSTSLTCMTISKSSSTLYLGTSNGFVFCLAYPSFEVLWSRSAHRGSVLSLSCPSNGDYVASSGQDSVIRLFGKASQQFVGQLECHTAAVNSIKFDRSLPFVLHTSSDDRCLVSTEITTSKRLLSHFLGDARFVAIDQLASGEGEIVSADTSKRITIFDVDVVPSIGLLHESAVAIMSLSCSSTRRLVAVGFADGNVKLFEVEFIDVSKVGPRGSPSSRRGGIVGWSEVGHAGGVSGVVFTSDEKQVVSVGQDCALVVWNFYKYA
ncbi:hypothetical protein RCL1_000290 [Eukaryota sp. TZLM3-RCL]